MCADIVINKLSCLLHEYKKLAVDT